MSVPQILPTERPVLLIHQSYRYGNRLPEIVCEIATRYPQLRVGVVARMSQHSPRAITRFLNACRNHAELLIADPEIFNRDDVAARTRRYYDHFTKPVPPGKRDDIASKRWVKEILTVQESLGANVLLSPGIYIQTDSSAKTKLDTEIMRIRQALDCTPALPVMANFTLDRYWLTDHQQRAALLNEMVDLNSSSFYVRVKWPVITPRYSQLKEPTIIRGYKEMASCLAEEAKSLVLPNTGLAGWLCVAFGATGFSSGIGHAQQSFAEERKYGRRPGSPGPRRIERYFERSILHIVDRETHQVLAGNGKYRPCQCMFCRELAVSSSGWDEEAAWLHYIWHCAGLTAKLCVGDRQKAALQVVAKALSFHDSLGRTVTGPNCAQHLTVWHQCLAQSSEQSA